jgi:hypothetical protein
MKLSRPVLISLLLTFCCSHASAQSPDLTPALRSCLSLTDNLARLTCYDDLARQLPALAAEPATAAPAPVAPTLVSESNDSPAPTLPAATTSTPVAEFGQPGARVEANAEGSEELVDRVVEAKRVEPTRWLLTLESGQVWRQSVGKSYLIRPGDTVRISPTSWGSDYRLSVEGRRGYIQVTRQE